MRLLPCRATAGKMEAISTQPIVSALRRDGSQKTIKYGRIRRISRLDRPGPGVPKWGHRVSRPIAPKVRIDHVELLLVPEDDDGQLIGHDALLRAERAPPDGRVAAGELFA